MTSIRERAGAAVDHHYDQTNPDKPLWLMFPAGAVAVVALLWAVWICYQAWFAPHPQPAALKILPITLVFYFAGVFYFSYGYELYNTGRAVKLTITIGLIGLAAVVIVVALGFVLGALGKRARSAGKLVSRASGGDAVSGVGRLVTNVALRSNLVSVNADAGGPRGVLNINLPHGHPAGTCSYCARPLPPPGSPRSGALVDPERFCPKCGQEFEPAGDRAARAAAATDAAPVAVPDGGTHGSCLRCGVFGALGIDGLCARCELQGSHGSHG